MNTVEEQTESRITTNRARPLTDGPIFAELCDMVASRSAEVNLDRSATTISSRSATKRAHRLTRDSHSSHLVNVLCAYTAFTMLTTGLVLILWGAAVKS